MPIEQDMKVIFKMEKEKDLENIFGIKINIMKGSGKKENRMEKVIFLIKEMEYMLYGKRGIY